MPELRTVKCACGCGREFVPRNNRHKYYDAKCRKSYNQTKHLGSGVSVRGNKVTVKGVKEVLLFSTGLY